MPWGFTSVPDEYPSLDETHMGCLYCQSKLGLLSQPYFGGRVLCQASVLWYVEWFAHSSAGDRVITCAGIQSRMDWAVLGVLSKARVGNVIGNALQCHAAFGALQQSPTVQEW